MQIYPSQVQKQADSILITWSDGSRAELSAKSLRQTCPCATCREARGDNFHAEPLSPAPKSKSLLKVVEHSADQQLKIEELRAVGNYAISIRWGDGHSSGIYTFEHLHALTPRA